MYGLTLGPLSLPHSVYLRLTIVHSFTLSLTLGLTASSQPMVTLTIVHSYTSLRLTLNWPNFSLSQAVGRLLNNRLCIPSDNSSTPSLSFDAILTQFISLLGHISQPDNSSFIQSICTPFRFAISICSTMFKVLHSDNNYTMFASSLPIVITSDLFLWFITPLQFLTLILSLIVLPSIPIIFSSFLGSIAFRFFPQSSSLADDSYLNFGFNELLELTPAQLLTPSILFLSSHQFYVLLSINIVLTLEFSQCQSQQLMIVSLTLLRHSTSCSHTQVQSLIHTHYTISLTICPQ